MISEALATLDAAIEEYAPEYLFALFSGGHDSLAATAMTAKHPRFTAAVHINTGIGIEQTREFVRETCREQGWPLLEYGPPDTLEKRFFWGTYEDMVLDWGFPGPTQHKIMYSRLKEGPLQQLSADHKPHRLLFSTGIRWDESVRRMRNYVASGKFYRIKRWVWANAIAEWSSKDCLDFIEQEGLKKNPVVDLLHMSGECLCGAFARKDEIKELELWFPETAKYIHDLERRVQEVGQVGCVWGRPMDEVNRDQQRLFPILPLCHSCESEI